MAKKRYEHIFYRAVYDHLEDRELMHYEVVDLLNEQDERIKTLVSTLKSDKSIQNIIPLLHAELKEIMDEEIILHIKAKRFERAKALELFKEALGIDNGDG